MPQNTTNSQYRVSDPVLTQFIHGYAQANSIAPFIAPVVPVQTRSGKIVKFTKENFAVVSTRRAPGTTIQRVGVNYTNESFYLYQHAVGAEVTEEAFQEALNGEAKLNLREMAATRAMQVILQSWELEVVTVITDGALYEAELNIVTAGPDQFNNAGSDPEVYIQSIKELIRAQVGVYPTRLVMDVESFNALKFHPIFRDRIKYTQTGTVNLDLLASWLDLPGGIQIAARVFLNNENKLQDFMPRGTAVLFYAPEDSSTDPNGASFLPDENADVAEPSAFYTYQLQGTPIAGVERFDDDRRVYVTDVVAEQHIVPVGLGATGLIGAAALITNLLA